MSTGDQNDDMRIERMKNMLLYRKPPVDEVAHRSVRNGRTAHMSRLGEKGLAASGSLGDAK
jgi:hypothetical protein